MAASHNAPWYSQERLSYFEEMMKEFAEKGGRYLVFTPPHTRGSLLTLAEAWILNRQRPFVPTLDAMGRWPEVSPGVHPHDLSRDQSDWLCRNWGEGARQWADSQKVHNLADARGSKNRSSYADLVMQKFCDLEHEDRRNLRDKKSEIERAARNRL